MKRSKTQVPPISAPVVGDQRPERRDAEIARLRVAGHPASAIALALGLTKTYVELRLRFPHIRDLVEEGVKITREEVVEAIRDRALGEVARNFETLVEVRDGRTADGAEVRTTGRDRLAAAEKLNAIVPEMAPRRGGDGDDVVTLRIPTKALELLVAAVGRDPGPGQVLPPGIGDQRAARLDERQRGFRQAWYEEHRVFPAYGHPADVSPTAEELDQVTRKAREEEARDRRAALVNAMAEDPGVMPWDLEEAS